MWEENRLKKTFVKLDDLMNLQSVNQIDEEWTIWNNKAIHLQFQQSILCVNEEKTFEFVLRWITESYVSTYIYLIFEELFDDQCGHIERYGKVVLFLIEKYLKDSVSGRNTVFRIPSQTLCW